MRATLDSLWCASALSYSRSSAAGRIPLCARVYKSRAPQPVRVEFARVRNVEIPLLLGLPLFFFFFRPVARPRKKSPGSLSIKHVRNYGISTICIGAIGRSSISVGGVYHYPRGSVSIRDATVQISCCTQDYRRVLIITRSNLQFSKY